MTRKHIIISLLVLAAAGLTAIFVLSQDSEAPAKNETTEQSTTEAEIAEPSETTEQEQETTEEPEEKKQPAPVVSVSEKPILSNSYGQVEVAPIEADQLVSSSCTTDPGVECTLTFTSQNSDDEVIFDAMTTDTQGVAVWEWRGNQEVPSGTWTVIAQAGETQSNSETIYIR